MLCRHTETIHGRATYSERRDLLSCQWVRESNEQLAAHRGRTADNVLNQQHLKIAMINDGHCSRRLIKNTNNTTVNKSSHYRLN